MHTTDEIELSKLSPMLLAAKYKEINDQKNACEKQLARMKPFVRSLVPDDQKAVTFKKEIDGIEYEYVVERVIQDRRVINEDMLAEMLVEKHLTYAYKMKATPIADHVAELVANGTLKKEAVEACLTGPITTYATVKLRRVSED